MLPEEEPVATDSVQAASPAAGGDFTQMTIAQLLQLDLVLPEGAMFVDGSFEVPEGDTDVVDLTELRSWSAEGQVAIAEAARCLTEAGRSLELAAIPADGSLVPTGDGPPIPVHHDLAAALAAHGAGIGEHAEGRHEWRTTGWPDEGPAGE